MVSDVEWQIVAHWKLLFKKYVKEVEDSVEFIAFLQQLYEDKMPESVLRQFQFTLEAFYDEDIVSEEAIIKWASEQEEDEEAQKSTTYLQVHHHHLKSSSEIII